MCGICGIWGRPDESRIRAMTAAMHHRGPDDCGVYQDDHVALGMARLAVVDLSEGGHQPKSNTEQTITIVYNGEMYNFLSERKLLEDRGHRFASSSDTEVVLRLYEEYGDNFLTRIRGMFALAIYDRRRGPGKERLVLARDPLGQKPLLYSEGGGSLVFASELKCLIESGRVARDIDPDALRLLLTYGSITQPHTMLRDVRMLLPGHRMIVDASGVRIERYWALGTNRRPELRAAPYQEQVEALSQALTESVRLHMLSDVPLGAFLSGGLDSSILVALMTRAAGKRVKTFSVGFETEGASIDESGEAQDTARFLGTDHTHVLVNAVSVRDEMHRMASGLDQPSVDGINSYFVSKAARQAVTVAISGTGGDELFAGYPWYRNMAAEDSRHVRLRGRAAAAVARLPVFDRLAPGRLERMIRSRRTVAGFRSRYSLQYSIFGVDGAEQTLAANLRRRAHVGRAAHWDLATADELSHGTTIERVTGLVLRGYTSNQLLRDIDAMSMSHSLEVRVPYLDPVLADLALSLPDSAKLNLDLRPAQANDTYRSVGTKRILMDVGRALLPPDFDERPKRGFAMPFDDWLRGPLRDMLMDTLSPARVIRRGWFDPAGVERVKNDFFDRKEAWPRIWLLFMTELWAEQVLDRGWARA